MAPGAQYRKLLKDIADDLKQSDVGSMKFVCRDKIGGGSLEQIPNDKPWKLFELMEEQQLISSTDLTLLREILELIQRRDLVAKIPSEMCRTPKVSDATDSGAPPSSPLLVSGDNAIQPYRRLLKALASELTMRNIDELKFLLNIPRGKADSINNGEDLLTYLQTTGQLSATKLDELKGLLLDIYRKDMIKMIDEFLTSTAHPQPPSSPAIPVFVQPRRDQSSCYPMRRQPYYGFALVINIKTFHRKTEDGSQLPVRTGSDVDLENLEHLWDQLGFQVESHKDLSACDIYTKVQDMKGKIERDEKSSCFVCCIMSHGKLDGIYGSDAKLVYLKDITNFFKAGNCPTLEGKPKLFFIQACRGTMRLTGYSRPPPTFPVGHAPGLDSDAFPSTVGSEPDDDGSVLRHKADPDEPHFLLGYSTPAGYVSFRSVDHGTWYVSALVKTFSEHYQEEDVMSMMTKVNHIVSDAYTSKGDKQCPAPVFTLVKKIFF